MNNEKIIKWINRGAYAAILILIYWIFIAISSAVFGLKVFKENLTEIFVLSLPMIIAALCGTLIVNIMINMTRIADSLSQKYENKQSHHEQKTKKANIRIIIFVALFPIIFGLLYLGDVMTSQKKERYITESAEQLVKENSEIINQIAKYEFSKEYIDKTADKIELLEKLDENFPYISIIVKDTIDNKEVFLYFTERSNVAEEKEPRKVNYIFATSKEEKANLDSIFAGHNNSQLFSANDGKYELYYPIKTSEKTIILYLSEYQNYGKIGS
jgi:hypothetical protein